jgi:hypothetical protein
LTNPAVGEGYSSLKTAETPGIEACRLSMDGIDGWWIASFFTILHSHKFGSRKSGSYAILFVGFCSQQWSSIFCAVTMDNGPLSAM